MGESEKWPLSGHFYSIQIVVVSLPPPFPAPGIRAPAHRRNEVRQMSAQPKVASEPVHGGGPYWEELSVGDLYVEFPAMTLNEGHAALHQSIVGDRLRLALDATLPERVAGRPPGPPVLLSDGSVGEA